MSLVLVRSLDALHRGRAGDRFGHRGDPEQYVLCHWRAVSQAALAEYA
jgi:hypothetical protein